jgi:hypothetical protein
MSSSSALIPNSLRRLPAHRPLSFIQLKKYFTFEVQVLDDKNVRRRFRASNYQSTTRVKPFICTMPMRLDEVYTRYSSLSAHARRLLTTRLRFQILYV